MPPTAEELYGSALGALRIALRYTQKDLARLSGLTPSTVSKLEHKKGRLTRQTFEELAVAMGTPRSAVDDALAFVARVRPEGRRSLQTESANNEMQGAIDAMVAELTKSAGGFSRAWFEGLVLKGRLLEAKQRAPALRLRLFENPPEMRLTIVREVAEFQDWGLCVLLCDESVAAAPDSAADARVLAELALEIAHRVPGEPGWRSRLEGMAGGHLANAWRVGGTLPEVEKTFAQALHGWEAGAKSDPGLLDPIRMLELEASLRKDQRRLEPALDLLERALAARPAAEVEGRLLIKQACVLEKLGNHEEAISALRRAAPLIEGAGSQRLRFAWRFGRLVNLCHLDRHAEAEALLGDVQALAGRLGKGLDLLRLKWLEGRIAAGLGRMDEALAIFEQVRAELEARKMPYDAALVILDIAALLAQLGKTTEVKQLAQAAAWIFQEQGVHREALRALAAFRRAATRERLTADLARSIARFLRRAEHDAKLRFREDAA